MSFIQKWNSLWNKPDKFVKKQTTLSDIIRGIQYSVNSCREITEQSYIDGLKKFFDPETNKPVTRQVRINDSAVMDIPLVCIADQFNLAMHEMDVDFSVYLKNIDLKSKDFLYYADGAASPLSNGEVAEIDRASFNVELTNITAEKQDTHMNFKIKFKTIPPPEAIHRITDTLINGVQPYDPAVKNTEETTTSQPKQQCKNK